MNPWPVAHTLLKGDRFKIYEALPVEGQGNPGEILSIGKKELMSQRQKGVYPSNKCSQLVNLRWILLPSSTELDVH